jgi:S-DNA-T family DNA segregation ATPase FtsK/SpoIIIE
MLRDLALAYALVLGAWLLLGRLFPLALAVLGPPAALGVLRWWPRRARSKVRASGSPLARRRARRVGERWVAWLPTQLEGARIIEVTPEPAGGWSGTVELAPGDTIASVQPRVESLESTLGLRPGSITVEQDPTNRRRTRWRVQVGDPITDPVPWPGAPPDASILRPATIGQFLDNGDPLRVPLRGECILVAGRRGAGKSGVINALIGYLSACEDAALVGIDLKGGLELGPWARVFAPGMIARTLPDARRLLRALTALMDVRMGEMAGADRDWPYSPQRPAVVMVVDEQSLVKNDRDALRLLEEVVVLGRALGITVIMGTQYPTKGAIGSPALVEQITVTIGLRVRSQTASRVLFGEQADREGWRPHEIPAELKGGLYLEAPGADRPRLARAWYVTDEKVREMVARYAGRRPVLGLDAARPENLPVDGVRAGSARPNYSKPDNGDGSGGGEADPILEALRTAGPDGLTMGQLLALVEMPRSTVNLRLDTLRDDGLVDRPERGRYVATERDR